MIRDSSIIMEAKNQRYHENPFLKNVEGGKSQLCTIEENGKVIVNESLEKRIRATLTKLITEIDTEYEASDRFRDHDYSVYVGTSGQAMFYFFYYLSSQNGRYLERAQKLIDRSLRHLKKRRFSFLNGDAGPLAVGALIYDTVGKHDKADECVEKLKALSPQVLNLDSETPDEILYGRAGYLYSLLFVNKHIKSTHIDTTLIRNVVESILNSGKELSARIKSKIPLEYEWHEKNYYGAAHGKAGILYMLLKANVYLTDTERDSLIKPTLDALLQETFPSGNLKSSHGSAADRLVQWCHGSPGFVSLLQMAYEMFKDKTYLDALIRGADNVWHTGLLRKGYSLCHGVSGNAYAFLCAYHVTHREEYLQRALSFADWCTLYNQHEDVTPDRPYSLYEGKPGVAFFLLDILKPTNARFPGYEDI